MSEITELIIPDHYDYKEYKVDQCVTTNINYLKNICEIPDDDNYIECYKNETLPFLFHPYTEDITIEKRAKLLKLGKESSQIWISDNKIDYEYKPNEFVNVDGYHDDDAEQQYLLSTPTSYIVFSKPNIGEVTMARILSERMKCVFISPESVIRDEISSGSRVGKCIKFNLQNGRAIGPEVILRLVEKRIKSQTAQHRGFVIAGFPLIPNHFYKDDPLSSESAVFNVEEIFEDVLIETIPDRPASASTLKGSKVTLEAGEEEEQEHEEIENYDHDENISEEEIVKKKIKEKPIEDLDLGPELGNIIKTSESFDDLFCIDNQLKFLFSLFNHDMITIYVACNNLDVVNKTEFYRFDLNYEEQVSFEKYPENLTSLYQETESNRNFYQYDNKNELKTAPKLPIHLNESISCQLSQYKFKVQSFIDRKILDHDPQYVIKVDGRLSPETMFTALHQRLKSLGLQPVLIPENLNQFNEIPGEYGEEPPETTDEDSAPENAFKKFRLVKTLNRMYKWRLSHWGYKCPVAHQDGKRLKGEAQHAIRFMDKIYFLSDANAELKFCRNPRPYLIPIKIKPTHRIFIIGPKRSSKTMLSKCLSILFNSHVLDISSIEYQYETKKKFEYLEKVRTAAITEGLVELSELNKTLREHNIKNWMKNLRGMLLMYYSDLQPEKFNYEMPNIKSTASIMSSLSEKNLQDIEIELKNLNIQTDDKNSIKLLLENDDALMEFLPDDLSKPIDTPSIHDPFITNYVNEALASTVYEDTPLTNSEKSDMFQSAIKKFELNFGDNVGWIVDGFPPESEIIQNLNLNKMPDIVICLRDEDPENLFLLAKFARNDPKETVEFRNFFRELRKFSTAERVPNSLGNTYKHMMDTIKTKEKDDDIFEDVELVQSNRDKEYADHLSEFNEKWSEIEPLLTKMCSDPPIEINIANKSLAELLKDSIVGIENKYRITASYMTDDEKMEELRDFGEAITMDEEEEMGEGGKKNTFEDNRRYGDTNKYCPVAFFDYFVLWKGKENFAATFENKTYLLSTQQAMVLFVENPYIYLRDRPSKEFPPPRICITGAIGSGKTTLAKKIAENFGLFYVNFEDILLKAFNLDTITKVDDLLQQHDKTEDELFLTEKEILRNYHIDEEYFLPEFYLKKSLDPLWHSSPYQKVGFVLDHFPRKANDLNFMKKFYYIPDVVLELEVNEQQLHDRLFNLKLDKWREELELKKKQAEEDNKLRMKKWEDDFNGRVNFLREILRDERKQEFLYSQPPVPPFSSPVDSTTAIPEQLEEEENEPDPMQLFVYDPVQEKVDLEEIYKRVQTELPKPAFRDQWESEEEATARIEEMLNEIHDRDLKHLKSLKFVLKKDNIDCISILTVQEAQKIYLETSKILETYKFRNKSFFERVYPIAIDVAEKLLDLGNYFMSKFGRMCPVQVYEKINPIQMYLTLEHKMNIFPVIYRRYIYFICGKNHLENFQKNPLLYTENKDYQLPLLPLRIAIIGPPKSGKSYLADRFQKEYGLKVVTRGEAARYVLKRLQNYELAKSMKTVLEKGWSLTFEMIAAAVEAFTLDGKSITQGYVLDGFPSSVDEMQHLKYFGIIPHVCFYVSADEDKVEECTKSEPNRKFMTAMSHKFIQIRYKVWQKDVANLTNFMKKEFQNVYWIEGVDSKWEIWDRANKTFSGAFFDVLNYLKDRNLNKAHDLKSMCVTTFEFFERQSSFQNFCPCCMYFNNYLVSGGCPPNRIGLVQYHENYYWICDEHFKTFMNDPQRYLPPDNDKTLPEDIPEVGNVCCVGPKCCSQRYYENGLCIVCFWDNQPKRMLKIGEPDYAALYNDIIYVFCSFTCQQKFIKEPHVYFDKKIHFRNPIPLELKQKLPIMGYLEQYVVELLTRAIVSAEVTRPVHPFMDIQTSALIYIALYLKLHNPKTNPDHMIINKERMNKFENRIKKIKSLINYFLSNQNPFCEDVPCEVESKSSMFFAEEQLSMIEYSSEKLSAGGHAEKSSYGEMESFISGNTSENISFYNFE